jgi:hypothetical protein
LVAGSNADIMWPKFPTQISSSSSQVTIILLPLEGDYNTPPSQKGDYNTPASQKGDYNTPPSQKGDYNTPPSQKGDYNTPPSLKKVTIILFPLSKR